MQSTGLFQHFYKSHRTVKKPQTGVNSEVRPHHALSAQMCMLVARLTDHPPQEINK